MVIRALTTVVLTVLLTVLGFAAPGVGAGDAGVAGAAAPATVPDDDATRPTLNEFLPEQRSLSDCLGALQRPNCGSEARGGWAQTAVFVAIVGALGFIAWRVVAGSRRARRR